MSSSERVESGHAFFKRYVSRSYLLVDFMIQFGMGFISQRHKDLMANHKDLIKKHKIIVYHDFLAQMVDIYTINVLQI